MKGEELIKAALGKPLEAGKLNSFYLKGEFSTLIISTFLKFDKWLQIVSTDEMTKIYEVTNLREVTKGYEEGDFKYPVSPISAHFPDFEKYIGKKLVSYKELVRIDFTSLSFGINLYFENDLNFVIHNHDYPEDRNEYYFKHQIPDELIEK